MYSETLELSNIGISNRTISNSIELVRSKRISNFGLRKPMLNSVRFDSVSEKSSRVEENTHKNQGDHTQKFFLVLLV